MWSQCFAPITGCITRGRHKSSVSRGIYVERRFNLRILKRLQISKSKSVPNVVKHNKSDQRDKMSWTIVQMSNKLKVSKKPWSLIPKWPWELVCACKLLLNHLIISIIDFPSLQYFRIIIILNHSFSNLDQKYFKPLFKHAWQVSLNLS